MLRTIMPKGVQKNTPERIEDAQMVAAVLNLRKGGIKFDEIGLSLGINETQARRIVERAIAEYDNEALQDAQAIRAMVAMRMEELYSAFHPKAVADGDYRAAEFCRGILQDTVKLFGLAASTKLDVKHENADKSIRIVGQPVGSKDEPPRAVNVLAERNQDGDDTGQTTDD